ncbi:hypothetical protein Gotri_025449 [Gossypium trilobum]|uniref:RNase H type-1 domain-containing protein n=1 Tax=Gossypium trilobum TaxID=34281 RepID=A0A7J9FIX8_9ROSI|nr:hypothetical protein [Gossypium trilobum]
MGNWILGFNRRLGQCSIFNAELWGILDSLSLFQSREYGKVLIQTDNLEAIQEIQAASSKTSHSALIRRIHQLLLETGLWEFEHIPREENIEVYDIAKLAFNRNARLQLFTACPLNISR